MTAKEKAKELFDKQIVAQIEVGDIIKNVPLAKQSALLCVNEILDVRYHIPVGSNVDIAKYWKEVKEEIEKL